MRAPLLALAVIAGCHSNVEVSSAALEGRSALIWIYADGQLASLWGANLVDGRLDPAPPSLVYKDELELLAMTFACPITDTGLTLGSQELLEFPEYDEPRTPAPQKIWITSVKDGAQDEWRALSELDQRMTEALLRLDLPADNVCAQYSIPYTLVKEVRIAAPNFSMPVFAERIDDTRIVLGTSTGHMFEISADGTQRPIEDLGLDESPEAIEFRGAFRDDDGTLWLYAGDGRMARGTIDGGFEMLPFVGTATGTEITLAGGHAGDGVELFAVSNQRKLAHFDGTGWETVYQGFEDPFCSIGLQQFPMPPTATWVAPGEAVVHGAGEPSSDVLRFRSDEAFEEMFPESAGQPASVIQTDLGTFAGTCDGDLVRRVEQSWVPAFSKRAETAFPIVSLVRSGAGFLYAGASGFDTRFLASYHPAIGYCEALEVDGVGRFMVRAGSTIFLVYFRLGGGPIQLDVFEEGEAPCFAAEG